MGVDDEIRDAIKETRALLSDYNGNKEQVISKANEAISKAEEMIFKEENILFPMVLDTLSEDEWIKIEQSSGEFGYTLTQPAGKWQPVRVDIEQKAQEQENIRPQQGIRPIRCRHPLS